MCGKAHTRRADARFCSKKCMAKAANLRLLYGIGPEEYRAIFDRQGNACAVCKTGFPEATSHVDHDHASGRVRGILCSQCNVALGMLQEDEARILALAAYIHSA